MGIYINKGNIEYRMIVNSKNNVFTVLIHIGYLAYDENTQDTAIDQIKRKQYPSKLADYTGDILLVGNNYDKEATSSMSAR